MVGFKLLSGFGIVGTTIVAVLFGLSSKKESDRHNAKMDGYRNIASQTRFLISSNSAIKDMKLVVMDPESEKWDKRKNDLFKYKKDAMSRIMPDSVVNGEGEKLRDWCYEKMEERKDDLKDENIYPYFNETSGSSDFKVFWPYCVPEEHEIK